jgi:hypothetical protein
MALTIDVRKAALPKCERVGALAGLPKTRSKSWEDLILARLSLPLVLETKTENRSLRLSKF